MDHVAIDLGGRESQVCIRDATNQVRLERRVRTAELKQFLNGLGSSRVILETCAEAFAVAVDAKASGHDVRVVPATLVRALGVGRRGIKTDVRDARCLSEASVRMDLGSVHIPSSGAREMKTLCSLREGLVRSRTLLVNNVRGWLRGQLLEVSIGNTPTFPARLRACFAALEREVPGYVERQLVVIESLSEQIGESDREVRQLAAKSEECRRVMTVPGVGAVTAIRFVAAIDDISRFKTAHEVESYFGLTPGEQSSSETKHRTGLTKAGASAVRWLLVQAAWSAWRTRPNDPMVLWSRGLFERKKSKCVAIAALARKMAGVMFALLRDKSEYQAQQASTVRAGQVSPVLVASGTAVTAMARAATPEIEPPFESLAPTNSESPEPSRAPASGSKPRRPSRTTALETASRSQAAAPATSASPESSRAPAKARRAEPSKSRSRAGWEGSSPASGSESGTTAARKTALAAKSAAGVNSSLGPPSRAPTKARSVEPPEARGKAGSAAPPRSPGGRSASAVRARRSPERRDKS